jgi:2-polyprenyl-3-methyl-5-hydroxy-6-metoxy-1,4-benzoquinol methylase
MMNQSSPTLGNDYEAKPQFYYAQARTEMVPYIPANCRRLLDVGCGGGDFAALIRQQRGVEVWGVEPVGKAAAEAAKLLNVVRHGEFRPELGLPAAHFDCVVFNDVLEHLIEPSEALVYARTLLTPKGVVVASIPNIRHFRTFWEIAVRGEWQYRDLGILDRTHLRFFTKKSIPTLFAASGFDIQRLEGLNPFCSTHGGARWSYFKIINILTAGRISDMKYLQFAVVANSSER